MCVVVECFVCFAFSAKTHEVENNANTWSPKELTIAKGDSVKWTFSDTVRAHFCFVLLISLQHNVAQSANANSDDYDGTGFRSGEIGVGSPVSQSTSVLMLM